MSEIICHCFEVSREEIENAIREKGLKTVEEVGEATNAGTGCGGCQEQIQEILDEINGKNNLPSSNNKKIPDENSLSGIFCYCVAE